MCVSDPEQNACHYCYDICIKCIECAVELCWIKFENCWNTRGNGYFDGDVRIIDRIIYNLYYNLIIIICAA